MRNDFLNFVRISPEYNIQGNEYSWALNFDNATLNLYDTGKLINTKGNKELVTVNTPSSAKIWNLIRLQSGLYAVITYTKSGVEGTLAVFKLNFSSNNEILTYVEIAYHYSINSTRTPYTDIESLGVDETEEVARIYISLLSGVDKLTRSIDITCNVLEPTPKLVSVEDADMPLLSPTVNVISGSMNQGLYKFCFRLIQKNGLRTAWSPLTEGFIAPVKNSSGWGGFESINSMEDYQVAPKSNVGFRIQLPYLNDSGIFYGVANEFTHAEICQVHYYLPGIEPAIEIRELITLSEKSYSILENNNEVLAIFSVQEFITNNANKQAAFSVVFNNMMFKSHLVSKKFDITLASNAVTYKLALKDSEYEYDFNTGGYKNNIVPTIYKPTKGLQRGSTYRVGTVFTDIYGNKSDVRFIQDIEVPDDPGLALVSGDKLQIYHLYAEIKDLPPTIYSIQLVYLERGLSDRPIISTGVGYFSSESLEPTVTPTNFEHLVIFTPEHLIGNVDYSKIRTKVSINRELSIATTLSQNNTIVQKLGTDISSGSYVPFTDWETELKDTSKYEPTESILINRNSTVTNIIEFKRQPRESGALSKVCSKALICGTADLAKNKVRATFPDCNNGLIEAIPSTGKITKYGTSICELLGNNPIPTSSGYGLILDSDALTVKLYKRDPANNINLPELKAEANSTTNYSEYTDLATGKRIILEAIQGATLPEIAHSVVKIKQDCTPYGGSETLNSNIRKFSPFSEVVLNNAYLNTVNSYGDTYVDFTIIQLSSRARTDEVWTSEGDPAIYAVFPIESSVNTRLVGDNLFDLVAKRSSILKHLNYKDNTQINYTINSTVTKLALNLPDLYTANSVYSVVPSLESFSALSNIVDSSTHFPNMIQYSERKYPGDFYDAYQLYKPLNRNENNTFHGQITGMLEFQSRLVVFQERAISVLRVNELSQIVDNSGSTLALGKGDIIGSAGGKVEDIVAINVGCSYRSNIIKSSSSLYWLDSNNRHIYRWQGINSQPQAISLLNGIPDLFKFAIRKNTKLIGAYHGEDSSVYLTLLNFKDDARTIIDRNDLFTVDYEDDAYKITGDLSELDLKVGQEVVLSSDYPDSLVKIIELTSTLIRFVLLTGPVIPKTGIQLSLIWHVKKLLSFTIVYKETTSTFTHILSLLPRQYITLDKELFSIPFVTTTNLQSAIPWKHTESVRNSFYGKKYPSVITFIINAQRYKYWELFQLFSEYFTNSATTNNDFGFNGAINKTVSYIKVKTLYRSTNIMKMIPESNNYLNTPNKIPQNNILDVHQQPDSSIPNSEFLTKDSEYSYMFNIRRNEDHWVIQIPKIPVIPEGGNNTPIVDPETNQTLYESIKNSWIEVTLFYNPENTTDIIKLNYTKI